MLLPNFRVFFFQGKISIVTVSPNLSSSLKWNKTSSIATALLVGNLIFDVRYNCLLSCLSQFGSVCPPLFAGSILLYGFISLFGDGGCLLRSVVTEEVAVMKATGTFIKTGLVASECSWAHTFLVPHEEDGRGAESAGGAFSVPLKQHAQLQ